MQPANTLIEALDLETLDRNLYRGRNQPAAGWPRLYGGQVAAQCLRAAALTVPDDRLPHSLHGYFLRAGAPDWPVILRVNRDRDGKSFSARHVEAVQHGEVIFTMSASFQVAEEGPEHAPEPLQGLPDPESLPESTSDWVINGFFDQRPVDGGASLVPDRIWIRARTPVGPDPVLQACALAYLSDFGVAYPDPQYAREGWGGPSLDHAIWFHRPIDTDGWVLIDLTAWTALGGRGLYTGVLRDPSGVVGATVAQQHLLRKFRW